MRQQLFQTLKPEADQLFISSRPALQEIYRKSFRQKGNSWHKHRFTQNNEKCWKLLIILMDTNGCNSSYIIFRKDKIQPKQRGPSFLAWFFKNRNYFPEATLYISIDLSLSHNGHNCKRSPIMIGLNLGFTPQSSGKKWRSEQLNKITVSSSGSPVDN